MRCQKLGGVMRSIIFDSGPIISFSVNNLLWVLKPLSDLFKGDFFITEGVKKELVDNPFSGKRFKFEALQVEKLIEDGVLKVALHADLKNLSEKLLFIANNSFSVNGNPLHLFQYAEIETVAFAILSEAQAVVVDERATRSLIENPESLRSIMERRLHKPVRANNKNIAEFRSITKNLKVIRSTEMISVAFEQGLLNKYVVNIPNSRRELLDSVLWGLKLNGCAISENEINELINAVG